jgi:DNA-directed RNA polymerase specialized sigma subunit
MKVKMKVNTHYYGFRNKDDIIDVDENTAKRWQSNNIAEILEINDEEIQQTNDKITDYQSMSAKEIFNLCKERGINIDIEYLKTLKTNKERKKYLLTLL